MNLSVKIINFKSRPFSIYLTLLAFSLTIHSCASYNNQIGKNAALTTESKINSDKEFQIFLVGDAGNADEAQSQQTLHFLKSKIDSADKNSALIFLGDNIYPLGMPPEDSKDYPLAKEKLENQLLITKDFKGKTFVIPGNHDWYYGLKGLQAQEEFVKKYLNDKKSFLPRKSCPIDDINLTDNIKLITIDSEWSLVDWEKYPGINKDCDIKTRDDFFSELKDLINKNQDKQIIIAMHHPMVNSGVHGGFNSFKSHIYPLRSTFPLPIFASFINILRNSSGASIEDINNKHYADFSNTIKSMVQDKENIIFVSGHDHNLQYHSEKNLRQIISGAGSKTDPATITAATDFSYGGSGFAVLNIRENGSSDVEFFSTKNGVFKKLNQISVREKTSVLPQNVASEFPTTMVSTIYPKELTQKSSIYKWLFGEHYRKYYALPIEANVLDFSKSEDKFTPFREGGGNQSNSLRLIKSDGQEFVMRGIKKSAVRFLNNMAFKKNTFGSELQDTFPDKFLMDFYTANHPFTPFSVGNLAEKINLFHSNPQLYYIPKQSVLGEYNQKYGNELYMVEERFSSDKKTLESLENANDIVSTDDVLKDLRKNPENKVDQEIYLRARLFDMLIGDWDRHTDQWKWAAYKNDKKTVYKPIPRDRDQAFSKYDGVLFKIIMQIPAIRHMKTFKSDLKNVKWFNMEPYPMDLVFAKNASEEDWKKQAQYIKEHLSETEIKDAFSNLPKEVQDETIKEIQEKIISREKNLEKYASEYFQVLQKKIPLVGTVGKDKFVITKEGDSVEIQQYEIKKSEEKLVFEQTYHNHLTKEIWIFGLEDDDTYEVSGKGKSKINIRLIGGYNHDVYKVENGKNVKIYDFKSQKNTYETDAKTSKIITDDYDLNSYQFKRPKYNYMVGYPNFNFNPDDGIAVGFLINGAVNNFVRDPFSQKHSLKTEFYSATNGLSLEYTGIFKKALKGWDLELHGLYTTPHFTQNFFGLSNESSFDKEKFEQDYYRARISQAKASVVVSKVNWLSFKNSFELGYENNKIEKNEDRFVMNSSDVNSGVFKNQQFANVHYAFGFENYDNKAFPALGMKLQANALWKFNISDFNQNFLVLSALLNIDHRIDKQGKVVFANSLNGTWVSNENFEFYQAANIGGNSGLRAYRNQRFSGKSALVNSSEIRWNLSKVKNNLGPTDFGVALGYDFGRVWNNNEISQKWHQSVGGGVWIRFLESFSARVNYFTGSDKGRVSASLGMRF